MELLKQLEKRRAYRAIGSRPVEKEVLVRLVEAAHLAPSSANNQPWRFITVVEHEVLDTLKGTLTRGNYWAKKAPVITAVVTNPVWSLQLDNRDFAYFELGMAAMAYQLQAVQEQLIVHPIAGFDVAEAKRILQIGTDEILQTLIVLGYPGSIEDLNEKHRDLERSLRIRKPLNEVSSFDKWEAKLFPPSK